MGVPVSSDVVVGEVWAVLLVLFVAVGSLEISVNFLFPRVILGTLNPKTRPLPYGGAGRA